VSVIGGVDAMQVAIGDIFPTPSQLRVFPCRLDVPIGPRSPCFMAGCEELDLRECSEKLAAVLYRGARGVEAERGADDVFPDFTTVLGNARALFRATCVRLKCVDLGEKIRNQIQLNRRLPCISLFPMMLAELTDMGIDETGTGFGFMCLANIMDDEQTVAVMRQVRGDITWAAWLRAGAEDISGD
jgi:hypothetical protein